MLYFHNDFVPVVKPRQMDLTYRCGGEWFLVKFGKQIFDRLSHFRLYRFPYYVGRISRNVGL